MAKTSAPIKHGTRFGRDGHRRRGEQPCEPCRVAWNEACRERQQRARDRGWKRAKPTLYDLTCEQCGDSFRAEARAQRFCSQQCFGESRRTRTNALVHVGPRPESWSWAPHVVVTVVTLPKWWGVITNGPCAWCGETFTSTGHDARYCSRRCARARAKAGRGDFQISPTLRRAIYERDHWTCQLCQSPVDPDADPLSDWFPSLDHIVPQSHALIPDHSPANLRTAHRWCNAVRGDGRWHADLFEEAS